MGLNPLAGIPLKGIPTSRPILNPVGRLWPNGKFSVGYRPSPPDERLDMRSLADSWDTPPPGAGVRATINLVDTPKSHNRPQRGLKGITGYGRDMVKNGVYLMGNHPRRLPLTFATLTLPPLSLEERQLVSRNWSEVLRQTIQWLTRKLQAKGLPPWVVSCSEIQPERLKKYGEAYLHLHLVWPNLARKKERWGVDVDDLRSFWQSLIEREAKVTLPKAPNIKILPTKGDPGKELAKYLSKGSEAVGKTAEDLGEENLPRTWWNMSQAVRVWVKSEVVHNAHVGQLLLEWIEFDKGQGEAGLFLWIRELHFEKEGREVSCGHTGQLTPELNQDAHCLLVSS